MKFKNLKLIKNTLMVIGSVYCAFNFLYFFKLFYEDTIDDVGSTFIRGLILWFQLFSFLFVFLPAGILSDKIEKIKTITGIEDEKEMNQNTRYGRFQKTLLKIGFFFLCSIFVFAILSVISYLCGPLSSNFSIISESTHGMWKYTKTSWTSNPGHEQGIFSTICMCLAFISAFLGGIIIVLLEVSYKTFITIIITAIVIITILSVGIYRIISEDNETFKYPKEHIFYSYSMFKNSPYI